MQKNKISQITHPQVRDLCWVLSSPPLLDAAVGLPLAEFALLERHDLTEWLLALDANPQCLLDYLAGFSVTRLGQYFEALVLFAVESAPQLELLLKQQRFYDEKRTLGECDVIFRQRAGRVFHWELAVKFYLYHQGRYLGPNVRDRLDKKCRHLAQQQLRLPHTSPVKEQLEQAFGIRQLCSQAFVKGWLFYPLDFAAVTGSGVANDHLRGDWCPLGQLPQWLQLHDSSARYRLLPRLAWLSLDYVIDESLLLSSDELHAALACHFALRQQAQMVVMLLEREEGWYEQRRCMVVADGWPGGGG